MKLLLPLLALLALFAEIAWAVLESCVVPTPKRDELAKANAATCRKSQP